MVRGEGVPRKGCGWDKIGNFLKMVRCRRINNGFFYEPVKTVI